MTAPTIDWCWGVDVATDHIAIGALSMHTDCRAWTITIPQVSRGARRLTELRAALRTNLSEIGAGGLTTGQPAWAWPTAVVVEMPLIVRPDFRLLGSTAVTMEVIQACRDCPVLELPTTSWKLDVLGHGNASKDEIAAFAERLGYTGTSQDEADAVCIAHAARSRIAREQAA